MTQSPKAYYAKHDLRRCAVYRWFAPGGQLLYVGASVNPDNRWLQICAEETWTHYATRRTTTWYDTVMLARDGERAAIKTESPLLNLVGRVRGLPMFSDHWRELRLPDGATVTMLRAPHVHRWLVGDDEILTFLERRESGVQPANACAPPVRRLTAGGWSEPAARFSA